MSASSPSWGMTQSLLLLLVLGSFMVSITGTISGGKDVLCNDTCRSFNGICEDGGPGSAESTCLLGTDCSDCGPRGVSREFESLSEAAGALLDKEGVLCGGLVVEETNLSSLTGMENLTRVDGVLMVRKNPLMTGVVGLDNLLAVEGELAIVENGNLFSLAGLGRLTTVSGRFEIVGNGALTRLEGLENFQRMDGELLILENSGLTSLVGMEQLEQVNGDLRIAANSDLTRLEGLENLAQVNGTLMIANNSALIDVNGLRNLVHVHGPLTITDNSALSSIAGLESLAKVDGGLLIENNDDLRSINKFPKLTKLTGSDAGGAEKDRQFLEDFSGLVVDSNPKLNSIEGFSSLSIVDGDFVIFNNPNLSRIILDKLSEVTGRTRISVTSPDIRADVASNDALPFYAWGCQKRTNLIPSVLPTTANGSAFQTHLVLDARDCLSVNVAVRYSGFAIAGWLLVWSVLLLWYLSINSKSRHREKMNSQTAMGMFLGNIWAFFTLLFDELFIITGCIVIWEGLGCWGTLLTTVFSMAIFLSTQIYKLVGVWVGLLSKKVGTDLGLQPRGRCLFQELWHGGEMWFGDWLLFLGILLFEVEIIQHLPWGTAVADVQNDPKKKGFPHPYFCHVAFVARCVEDAGQIAMKTIFLVFLMGWGYWAWVLTSLSLTVSIGDFLAKVVYPWMVQSEDRHRASESDEDVGTAEEMNGGGAHEALL